ncbi:MAG: FlaD/FlaE family flagellar protein [Methanosarcinales archaeon]
MARSINERLTDLEEDVKVIKGTIKKLVIDIRELMSNMENPFHGSGVQQEIIKKSKTETNTTKDTNQDEHKVEIPELSLGTSNNAAQEPRADEKISDPSSMPSNIPTSASTTAQPSFGRSTQEPRAVSDIEKDGKIDLLTLTKLMEWAEHMLSRIGKDKFKDVLDFYVMTGYLPENVKKLMLTVAEFSGSVPGESDVMVDLYRLNKILNPSDKEMDSAVLSMILDDKRTGWMKILRDEGEKLNTILRESEK